jgi:hypothetical protein
MGGRKAVTMPHYIIGVTEQVTRSYTLSIEGPDEEAAIAKALRLFNQDPSSETHIPRPEPDSLDYGDIEFTHIEPYERAAPEPV